MKSFTATTILAVLVTLSRTGHALPSAASPSGVPIPANVKIPTVVNVTPGLPDVFGLSKLPVFTQVQDIGLLTGENPFPFTPASNSSAALFKRNDVATFQAFSGNNCDGDPGAVVAISDSQQYCIGTDGRHSFRTTGQQLIISADPSPNCPCQARSDCPGSDAQSAVAHCYNVNTGYAWESSFVFWNPPA